MTEKEFNEQLTVISNQIISGEISIEQARKLSQEVNKRYYYSFLADVIENERFYFYQDGEMVDKQPIDPIMDACIWEAMQCSNFPYFNEHNGRHDTTIVNVEQKIIYYILGAEK